MPIYTIQAPDGKTYDIEGPEGATADQLGAFITQNAPPPKKDNSSLVRSALRGARDIVDGGAQFLVRGANAIGLAPDSEVKRVEAINKDAEAQYAPYKPEGFDWGRMGGNAVLSALATRNLTPAATLIGRMGQGAAVGGASALASPEEDSDSYWGDKGKKVATGAALGGLLTPVAEGIVNAASKVVEKSINGARSVVGRVTPDSAVQNTVSSALQKGGIDFSKLAPQLQEELVGEANKALKTTGSLDQDALRRLAEFRSLGIKPTLGQVTRDPVQYSRELNLRGTKAGELIQRRLNEQTGGLFDNLAASRAGNLQSPYEAGSDIITSLAQRDEALKKGVKAAYEKAANSAGRNTNLNVAGVSDEFGKVLDDFGSENIPGAVMSRLKSYGLAGENQTKAYTIDEAEKLIKTINANTDRTKPVQMAALTRLKSSIQNSIDELGDSSVVGSEAAQAFQGARSAAKQRFDWHDMTPAAKAVVDGKAAPDDFINKFVLNAKVGDIKNLMVSLDDNQRNVLRSQIYAHLAKKAGEDASGEMSAFASKSFNNEIGRLGDERLTALLGKDGAEKVGRIGRVSAYMNKRPAGDAVNESKTAGTLADYTMRTLNLPFLRPLAGEPLEYMIANSRANTALNAPMVANRYRLNPSVVDAAAMRAGLLGAPMLFGAAQGNKQP